MAAGSRSRESEMNTGPATDRYSDNQQYLIAQIDRVYQHLKAYLEQRPSRIPALQPDPDSTLERLCQLFSLSPGDRDLLLFCAALELAPGLKSLCAQGHGDPKLNYPTFILAEQIFDSFSWSILAPQSPLQRWELIEIGTGLTLMDSPLRIDPRILCYLLGETSLDSRLMDWIKPVPELGLSALPPSHQELALTVSDYLSDQPSVPLEITGLDPLTRRQIVGVACEHSHYQLSRLSGSLLLTIPVELERLKRRWQREAQLSDQVLLLECDGLPLGEITPLAILERFIGDLHVPLILSSQYRQLSVDLSLLHFEVPSLTPMEQRDLWQHHLDLQVEPLIRTEKLDPIIAHFNLSAPAIQSASLRMSKALHSSDQEPQALLWSTCRRQARPKLDALARRISPQMSWEDLVLPEEQIQVLKTIVAQVRQRYQVYEKWGFAGQGRRGLGISALFHGRTGTGKTTGAEVIANELHLDLYQIDLSAVVSKYIGETEKNLAQVFDAAEAGGVILLFDEADALFGKRGDVKDARDRYANQEVSYLLQRMESYQGLSILTTNLKDSIDTAFERRLRFVVEFPFPDVEQREELWRRSFPPQLPTEDLDIKKLARLGVSGAVIRNIALNAAFLAADQGRSLGMEHLLAAAKSEGIKMNMLSMVNSETRGWIRKSSATPQSDLAKL